MASPEPRAIIMARVGAETTSISAVTLDAGGRPVRASTSTINGGQGLWQLALSISPDRTRLATARRGASVRLRASWRRP